MMTRTLTGCLLLALAAASAGCDGAGPSSPTAPGSVPPPAGASGFVAFTEGSTGFTTTDLRDVQEQILRITTTNELIWAADGSRLPGYFARGHSIDGKICPEGCTLVVRFGSRDGERRAYLTADYGHNNPGTVVDVEVTGGMLVVTRTGEFPPGSPTLSGVVTEMTSAGPVAVAGAYVAHGERDATTTDDAGFYEIRGLVDGRDVVIAGKQGYVEQRPLVVIQGDTRFDVQLRRK